MRRAATTRRGLLVFPTMGSAIVARLQTVVGFLT